MDGELRRAVRALDQYELRRLIMFAQGLLQGCDGPVFEPLEDAARDGVTYRQQWRRCGKENCTRCPHGPYWYAYWREDGRPRSRYVGKSLPEGVTPQGTASEPDRPAVPGKGGRQVAAGRSKIPEVTDDRSS